MATNIVTLRRMAWTGAIASITIAGTFYGARLKTDRDFNKEKRKIVEASTDEKIAILEGRRRNLETQKAGVEKKLAALRERMAKKAEAEKERLASSNEGR